MMIGGHARDSGGLEVRVPDQGLLSGLAGALPGGSWRALGCRSSAPGFTGDLYGQRFPVLGLGCACPV